MRARNSPGRFVLIACGGVVLIVVGGIGAEFVTRALGLLIVAGVAMIAYGALAPLVRATAVARRPGAAADDPERQDRHNFLGFVVKLIERGQDERT